MWEADLSLVLPPSRPSQIRLPLGCPLCPPPNLAGASELGHSTCAGGPWGGGETPGGPYSEAPPEIWKRRGKG